MSDGVTPSFPLESWQLGPGNRCSYLHVGELVTTTAVPRGTGPVWELSTAGAELDELVAGVLKTAYVDGLAVVHDAARVLERYGGEMGADSPQLSQSVVKSVLGVVVGILVGDGRLDPAVGR